MTQFNIPVEHLFTLTLEGLGQGGFDLDCPFGRRRLAKITGGGAKGSALEARVLPLLATDYGRVTVSGSIHAREASVVMETSDGVIVLMQIRSRGGGAYGAGSSRFQALFQVEDGPYGWLNGVQALGYGNETSSSLILEVYGLRGEDETEGPDEPAESPARRRTLPADFLFRRKSEHDAGAKRHVINAPLGKRYLTLAEGGGGVTGPELNGEFVSGYSWSPHRMAESDGAPLMQYDVQTLLRLSGDVPVLMNYTGTSSPRYRAMSWRTAVQFEAPTGPYEWLNGVQAMGFGRWAGDGSEYLVYALR